MMESFGGAGFFVTDPKDLKAALDAAMAHDGPALVNVQLHHAAGRKPQQFNWHESPGGLRQTADSRPAHASRVRAHRNPTTHHNSQTRTCHEPNLPRLHLL